MNRWLLALMIAAWAAAADAGVLHLAELNTGQVASLDRTRTAVILPGGILEQHGPYLPSYTDGYVSERLADRLAEAIGAREGWTALVLPQIPLGSSGANEIGARYTFPGSVALRNETLRAVYMDLADQLGEAGFRWILIVHLHGAPLQNRMLDQASDYFRHSYDGRMLHLYGLMRVQRAWGEGSARMAPDLARAEGFCVHVCIDETSVVLHLRPDLVDPRFRDARALTGADIGELREIARQDGWPGYFGTPQFAQAAYGQAVVDALAREMVAAALDLLDGHEDRLGRRFSEIAGADPVEQSIDAAALAWENRFALRQRRWLDQREPMSRSPAD